MAGKVKRDGADGAGDKPRPKLANFLTIGRFVAQYRGHVAGAVLALVVSAAATLAIPSAFRLIIDRGFGGDGGDIGRWFQYLLLIIVVMGVAGACASTSSPGSASAWWRTCAWRWSATCCAWSRLISSITARRRSPRG